MDSNTKIDTCIGKRGFALVWFIVLIPVILLFALMAIDFGYMYMTKGQLQNAADSAALAGAGVMAGGGTQSAAVIEAKKFALANQAAKQGIVISDSDIVFGYWDSATSTFTANGSPINAIQVRTARDAGSAGGQVPIFFGRYFGWDKMGASATATAAFSSRATIGLNMCIDLCDNKGGVYPVFKSYTTVANPPLVMQTGPSAPYTTAFAWTSYSVKTTAPGNDLLDQICSQDATNQSSCGQMVYSTMGGPTTAIKHLEAQMYNPNFDRSNKTFDASNNVTGWWVVIPITSCPPGQQGNAWDPKAVLRYSKVHILAICTKGGGSTKAPCTNDSAPSGVCNAIQAKYGLPNFDNNIVIDQITCVNCPASQLLPGLKPFLVK